MSDTEPGFALARVIEDLRAELLRAVELGRGQPLRFRLKPVEIELQVVVTSERSAEGGVKFWVVNIGGKASSGDTLTHTLKLNLEPVGAGGGEILVSDEAERD